MNFTGIENFGGIDADADALLDACFQDHPAYIDALKHQRFLVLGRKGSGKTAIFRRLIKQHDPYVFSFGHTFDDYPWPYHNLQAEAGVPEERRYVNSWRYLILMALSKLLLVDQSQPWDEEAMEPLRIVESFVVDSYGSRDPDLTQLFSPSKELRFHAAFNAKVLEVSLQTVQVPDLPKHFEEVNRFMTDMVMRALNPRYDYYVCFDQLDLGFSRGDSTYGQQLTGLILAARNFALLSKEYERRVSAVVFLRDDIYQLLQFEDKNKVTENNVSYVRWDQSGSELTLKTLMERRFAEVWRAPTSWEDVFDEAKEMTRRQTKYVHIRDRTFLRPRDMIKFCNETLVAHDAAASKFSNADVIKARQPYSQYLLHELDDEIHKHVELYEEYLDVLIGIRDVTFSKSQFLQKWEARTALADEDPVAGLRDLFEFSVIGYLRSGGGGGGSKYIWRYLDPRVRFDDDAEGFQVHPGFKEALDLTTRRRGS